MEIEQQIELIQKELSFTDGTDSAKRNKLNKDLLKLNLRKQILALKDRIDQIQ